MYSRIYFLVVFVLVHEMAGILSNSTKSKIEEMFSVQKSENYPQTTMNSRMKMKALQKKVDQFYDSFGADYEIDDRLNSSTLLDLDNLLSLKLDSLGKMKQLRARSLIKLKQLDTSCSRMKSTARCNNVVVLGLRYTPYMDDVFLQLKHLADHLGVKFDERYVKAIDQHQLIMKPSYSRLILTFKKVQTKQVFLLKFKLALEEYEKKIFEKHINYRTRKLGNVSHLLGCQIYMQDDIEKSDKIIFGELKKLQRRYSRYMHCYIKDSRVYYKLSNKLRPSSMDRLEDLSTLRKTLSDMIEANVNGSLIGETRRKKIYRSGTMFPWELYQFNRTRMYNMRRNLTSSHPLGLVFPPSITWT